VSTLAAELAFIGETHGQRPLDGVSVLGGEPLDQALALIELLRAVRAQLPELGIIVFTGYSFAELEQRRELDELWPLLDTLVDGPFQAQKLEARSRGRRYIGSSNQRLVHLSARYTDPQLWRGPAAAEVQVDADGGVSIHGEPELSRRLRLLMAPAAHGVPRVGASSD
jgi:anaerobic ribonucleoside-triphosphate reductase activating protein